MAGLKLPLFLLLMGCLGASAGTALDLDRGFSQPPASAKPWVYWMWLNGNITSNGITADLEAMQRVGIGGVLVMEVDYETPKGPVVFGSPEWHDLFRHLCLEAKRLGIEIRMNNDAGYCGSGGPWITPELSMQKLVWTETTVAGPARFDSSLRRPESLENFYRDIAVLTFPTPKDDSVRMTDFSPKLTTSTGVPPAVANRLCDGDTNTTVTLPQPEPGKPSVVQLEFPQPYTARQLVLRMPVAGDQIVHGWLQTSDDGREFKTVREFDIIPPTQVFNFPTVTARCFRVFFPTKNADVDQFVISEVELSPRYRIEGIEAKGLSVRKISYPGPSEFPGRAEYPELPEGAAIPRAQVLDLSSRLDQQGRLRWDVPVGSWTILRFGHTSTGRKNHPAPEGGLGLECDKLGKAGVKAAFGGLIARLAAESRSVAPGTLLSTHIDSWEVGSQNWTATLPRDFKKQRGYDLKKLLPVLTGRFVDSPEISERFLWDFRQTISELVVDRYAGRMRELAHRHGLRLSIEAYDAPCDDLTYAGRADEPMAEFWTWPAFEMAYTCAAMTSAAHVYGKQIVGAEAFTARDEEKWLGHPFSVKVFGDWAFCEGLNRFVIHRYALQPWTNPERRPGLAFGPFGLHYERSQTWWEEARVWNDYLARCQYLLQQGTWVADICYLADERAPRHWRNPNRRGERLGYNYDACPAEALLERASVRNGRLTFPGGIGYRVLALPETETMTPQLLARIKNLIESGVTVVGAPPAKSPGLSDFPRCDQQVARLTKEIWGDCDGRTVTERRLGKGKVFRGLTPAEVLAREDIPPDFLAQIKSRPAPLNWTHRALPGAEVYFVANKTLETIEATCQFRAGGLRPELWHPDTGRIERPAVYDADANTIRVPLRLDPAGSVFVVFRHGQQAQADRITSVSQDGTPLLQPRLEPLEPKEKLADTATNFTFAVWVKPEGGTTLPQETVFGKSIGFSARNDALFHAIGHFLYRSPNHAGTGLSVGTNGVWVTESSADYLGASVVYPVTLTNWTHVAVVYREARPSLYLNGKLVREGLQTPYIVHCGVDAPQRRDAPPFVGALGEFFHAHRSLSASEVSALAQTMPIPVTLPEFPPLHLTLAADGRLEGEVWKAGSYVAQTASGRSLRVTVSDLPAPLDLSSDWQLSFPPGWGAPERIRLDKLVSWSTHVDPGVRYFSGRAGYAKTFFLPAGFAAKDQTLVLDLGKVGIIARVVLNGHDLGTLWKPPFRVDITSAVKRGENSLEIQVVNLWANRMIGDENLPEDSPRNPNGSLKTWPDWLDQGKPSPSGRYTFTSYRLWSSDDGLQDSGLIGPVSIRAAKVVTPGSRLLQRPLRPPARKAGAS
ncbi:MAG TPA: glycosyl hydrolase [Verrucomicrobiae bacterium]